MSTISIQYYGLIGERIGLDREELSVPEDPCDVRALVVARHPVLAGLKWQVAVDHAIVQGLVTLRAGSEILILPPFAGG